MSRFLYNFIHIKTSLFLNKKPWPLSGQGGEKNFINIQTLLLPAQILNPLPGLHDQRMKDA
jgi:hypothetical protein